MRPARASRGSAGSSRRRGSSSRAAPGHRGGCSRGSCVIEPSCPVFIACSMSSASAARTSPTMMRSGRMRRAFFTRSRVDDFAATLDVGRPCLQPDHVSCWSCSSAASSMVTTRSPLGMKDDEGVQHRGLASAGAAGDEDVEPCAYTAAENAHHLIGQRSRTAPGRWIVRSAAEAPDRQDRAVDGERRDDGVDARSIRESSVHHRRRFIDAPTNSGYDSIDHRQQMRVITEGCEGAHKAALPLDVDVLGAR